MQQQTLSRFFKKNTGTAGQTRPVESVPKETPKKHPSIPLRPLNKVVPRSVKAYKHDPRSVVMTAKRAAPPSVRHVKKHKGPFKATPLEKQFIDLKKANMDKLLAVQVGYKYKFFGRDAQIAAKILNIMYIPGRIGLNPECTPAQDELYDRFSYCSIPDVRLHVHLKRLIHQGLKVGVVDQKETAIMKQNSGTSSKLFERKITRVYTSGTYIDDADSGSEGKSIICIKEAGDTIALVSANAYCADITYDQFSDDYTRCNLETRLLHLEPIEILAVGDLSRETTKCIESFRLSLRSDCDQLRLVEIKDKPLTESVTQLEMLPDEVVAFIGAQDASMVACFSELLNYMKGFELASLFSVPDNYRRFSDVDKNMILDSAALRNLEVFHNVTTGSEDGSLFWILDHTHTKFGHRRLKRLVGRPLNDREAILERLGAVESIGAHLASQIIERTLDILRKCPDLEVSLSKIHYSRSNRKETYMFLRAFNRILDTFKALRPEMIVDVLESHYLIQLYTELQQNSLDSFYGLLEMIFSPSAMDTKNEEAHIVDYFTPKFYDYDKIAACKESIHQDEKLLDAELEKVKVALKRPGLKYITNNGEPFLVEVRNTQVKDLPKDWIKINNTKSISRFRPPEVIKHYKQWLYHKELLKITCENCFKEFVTRIDSDFVQLSKMIRSLAMIDCLFSLSVVSSSNGYSKPSLVDTPIIRLKDARNPITEALRPNYIANSFQASHEEGRVAIITGPNMGGKSSFIRQIALVVIMAQIGCYIPATQGTLGTFDAIFIRMGAYDDILKGQSTFQVEMAETSTILEKCTERSLVLLDEIGRGTSSVDGCAIAYAILDYLCFEKKPFVLFITHFQNLQVFEDKASGVARNYHLGFSENNGDIFFTYKLTDGACERSYGVNCAKLASISDEIATRATEVSEALEREWLIKSTGEMMEATRSGLDNSCFSELWEQIDEFI